MWDVETGKKDREFTPPNSRAIMTVRFSSNGQRFLTGQNGGAISLFDVKKESPLNLLWGADSTVIDALFLNGDRFALTANVDDDKALRLWHLETGQVIAKTA